MPTAEGPAFVSPEGLRTTSETTRIRFHDPGASDCLSEEPTAGIEPVCTFKSVDRAIRPTSMNSAGCALPEDFCAAAHANCVVDLEGMTSQCSGGAERIVELPPSCLLSAEALR